MGNFHLSVLLYTARVSASILVSLIFVITRFSHGTNWQNIERENPHKTDMAIIKKPPGMKSGGFSRS
jgi:hypothetical protein